MVLSSAAFRTASAAANCSGVGPLGTLRWLAEGAVNWEAYGPLAEAWLGATVRFSNPRCPGVAQISLGSSRLRVAGSAGPHMWRVL